MSAIAYIANTNNIELNGLKSDLEGTYLNDASVQVTVCDQKTGDEVVGEAWPVTMQYVASSNGNYVAALTHTLPLTPNKKYIAFIDADGSSSHFERWGHWEFVFQAQTRTGN